jgi:hypothetical protein
MGYARAPDRTAPRRHPLECPGPALHPHGWAGGRSYPRDPRPWRSLPQRSTPEDRDRVHAEASVAPRRKNVMHRRVVTSPLVPRCWFQELPDLMRLIDYQGACCTGNPGTAWRSSIDTRAGLALPHDPGTVLLALRARGKC